MKIRRFNESIDKKFLLPEEVEDYFLEVKDVISVDFNIKPRYFGHMETCSTPFSFKYKDFWNQHVGTTEDLEVYIKSLESIKNVCKRFNLQFNLESPHQFEIIQPIPDCILNLNNYKLGYEYGYFFLLRGGYISPKFRDHLLAKIAEELKIEFQDIGEGKGEGKYKMVSKI